MTPQTAEQRVKEVWPDAVCEEYVYGQFHIYGGGGDWFGQGDTEQAAWQDAADKLTDKTNTP